MLGKVPHIFCYQERTLNTTFDNCKKDDTTCNYLLDLAHAGFSYLYFYCIKSHESRKLFSFTASSFTSAHDWTPLVETIFVGEEHGSWVDITLQFWKTNSSSPYTAGELIPIGGYRIKRLEIHHMVILATSNTKPKNISITIVSTVILDWNKKREIKWNYGKIWLNAKINSIDSEVSVSENKTLKLSIKDMFYPVSSQGLSHYIHVSHKAVNQRITLCWVSEMYEAYNNFKNIIPKICPEFRPTLAVYDVPYEYCFNFTLKSNSYLFYFGEFLWEALNLQTLQSWQGASEICQSVNSTLPIIRSRNELDDFITLVKHSPYVPPMTAIFIGLSFVNRSKVRILSSFEEPILLNSCFCQYLYQNVTHYNN